MDPCYAFSSAGSGRIVYKTRTYKQSLVEKFQFFTTRASPILDMSVRQFIVGAVLALSSLSFTSAVPQRRVSAHRVFVYAHLAHRPLLS